jgi:hypothetical protein
VCEILNVVCAFVLTIFCPLACSCHELYLNTSSKHFSFGCSCWHKNQSFSTIQRGSLEVIGIRRESPSATEYSSCYFWQAALIELRSFIRILGCWLWYLLDYLFLRHLQIIAVKSAEYIYDTQEKTRSITNWIQLVKKYWNKN